MIDFNNKKILFLGDSITQCGLYISYLNIYMYLHLPNINTTIINLGKASETASGLSEPDHPFHRPCIFDRIDSTLKKVQPNITFICYGMNDGIYYPLSNERFEAYKKGMLRLIEKVKSVESQVILMTPPPFDAHSFVKDTTKLLPKNMEKYSYMEPYENYDEVLKTYSEWIMTLSDKVDAVLDIHSAVLSNINKKRSKNKNYISGDGIHPNDLGHWAITKEILSKLYNIPIESNLDFIDSDIELFQLVIKQCDLLNMVWREYVESDAYPTEVVL